MDKCPLSGLPCPHAKQVHVTDVMQDGSVKTFSLCQLCAGSLESQGEQPAGPPSGGDILLKALETLFAALIEKKMMTPPGKPEPLIPPQVPGCPQCGSTLADIAKSGRLGCAKCYDHYRKELEVVIMSSHGSIKHVGKVPKNWKKQQEEKKATADVPLAERIASLEKKMAQAIKEERYEDAATIRDTIKQFREQGQGQGEPPSPASPSEPQS
jgi:protein arginine kinase activator